MEEKNNNSTTIEFEFEARDRAGTTIQKTRCLITSSDPKEAERLFIKFFQSDSKTNKKYMKLGNKDLPVKEETSSIDYVG